MSTCTSRASGARKEACAQRTVRSRIRNALAARKRRGNAYLCVSSSEPVCALCAPRACPQLGDQPLDRGQGQGQHPDQYRPREPYIALSLVELACTAPLALVPALTRPILRARSRWRVHRRIHNDGDVRFHPGDGRGRRLFGSSLDKVLRGVKGVNLDLCTKC